MLDRDHNLSPSVEELADLFTQDNVNDFHEDDAEVSISLHNLQKKYEGVDGLARHLDSNTKTGIEGSKSDL